MQPAARIQAAIDLVAAIESDAIENGPATDETVRHFFRQRRYAGSKDRRAVTTLAYEAVRNRVQDSWRLGEAAKPRLRIALRLMEAGEEPKASFSGATHAPAILSEAEEAALAAAMARDLSDAPLAARWGFPEFLTESLTARFGESLPQEMAALRQRAPLDLRVNLLKSTIEKARQQIAEQGIEVELTPYSPIGLRVPEGVRIDATKTFADGLVEVQDEGSQLAALLTGAKPGEQVLDLCAGAGGKTLALAAMMANKGQIYATDNDARRLRPLSERAKRANARNVQAFALDESGEERLAELAGKLDLVLIDSPCSGSGTWRRDPALPWRLTEERLRRLTQVQAELLRKAASLVGKGGRIAYVTCSILPQENEEVIEGFLSDMTAWNLTSYHALLEAAGAKAVPDTLARDDRMLQLAPGRHGTDGFFVAVLTRDD